VLGVFALMFDHHFSGTVVLDVGFDSDRVRGDRIVDRESPDWSEARKSGTQNAVAANSLIRFCTFFNRIGCFVTMVLVTRSAAR